MSEQQLAQGSFVAIYVRVSTEQQAEEEIPIDGQIAQLQAMASQNGWIVYDIIRDEGISGRTDDRPGFQRMIALAKQKPPVFQGILVWRNSRFARSVEHSLVYKALLRRHGVKVISANEPAFTGALGALVEVLLAAVDEFMAATIAEDTLRGLKQLASQGYSAGGRPPRGYVAKKLVVGAKRDGEPLTRTLWEPDPVWRDRALKAFELAAGGRSHDEIWRATGVVSNKSSMSTYLRNPAFIGRRVYNVYRTVGKKSIRRRNEPGEFVVTDDAHEAIVPQELWDRVQTVLEGKRRQGGLTKHYQSDYLLTGVLYCARHDCPMIGYTTRPGDGEYYCCQIRNKSGKKASDCPLLRREPLEQLLLRKLAEEVFNRVTVREMLVSLQEAIRQENAQKSKELGQIVAQLSRVERELQNLYRAVTDGIPASQLARPLAETTAQRDQLLARKAQTEQALSAAVEIKNDTFEKTVETARQILVEGDAAQKKMMIREYVSKVEVDGTHLKVHYAFKPSVPVVACDWLPEQDSNLQPSG